jgi:replication-associated recombination protein RarA
MTTTTLDADVVAAMRERRAGGESVKSLADELGVTWQKLDKAIRHGSPRRPDPGHPRPIRTFPKANQAVPKARLEAIRDARPVPLVEKYRPRTLKGVWGQPRAVTLLKRFARAPHPAAFLFEGETGTGKTSAALALGRELGCDVDQGEWGGVWEIASGEQSADAVRETARRMSLGPMAGSGWKVVIVNEADRMCRPAEVVWLDLLEHLPRQTVVVFTTNDADRLSQRFRDRCTRVVFRSDADHLAPSVRDYLLAVWRAETKTRADRKTVEQVVLDTIRAGRVSFRRGVQALGVLLMEREGGKP